MIFPEFKTKANFYTISRRTKLFLVFLKVVNVGSVIAASLRKIFALFLNQFASILNIFRQNIRLRNRIDIPDVMKLKCSRRPIVFSF